MRADPASRSNRRFPNAEPQNFEVNSGSSQGHDAVEQIQAGRNACLTLRWRDRSGRLHGIKGACARAVDEQNRKKVGQAFLPAQRRMART